MDELFFILSILTLITLLTLAKSITPSIKDR